MHSPDEEHLECPGELLWSLITKDVPEADLKLIETVLNPSMLTAYKEAKKNYELWQESRGHGNHQNNTQTDFTRRQGLPFSDPPALKELLRGEVKMLLKTLKERACNGERDAEDLLLQHKPETLHYVLQHQEITCSRPPNLKDADNISRSPCCSVMSGAEGEIEEVKDKLNSTEIYQVITKLSCILMEECEELNKRAEYLKESMTLKYESKTTKPEPSLIELKNLRASLQRDLELLPSPLGASSSAHVCRPKKSPRLPPLTHSDSQLVPKSDLPSLQNVKPRPPCHDPPARTSSGRTLGVHRFTIVKPSSTNRMGTEPDVTALCFRTSSRFPLNSEMNPTYPENHPSTQCCVVRSSTDFDCSSQRERKNSLISSSRNTSNNPSPSPPFGELCGEGSSSPGGHSESVVWNKQAEDGKNKSRSTRSSEVIVLQKNTPEKISGISLISGTLDQGGFRQNNSRLANNKNDYLGINNINQKGKESFNLIEDSSHYPKSRNTGNQLQTADTN
ncbi:PREDICTED: coiled-coil domain-containing protein 24 [Cyprinodon variegatus]|uniref:coiled-coil domain-containing protein 24 n=1 Tax=Cyprinodon variegatus TaxID=28743 RepID=UPI00074270E2|nr:PREDICTED: coiled-coil domain-containing protein 24 [Cyprinodon variegatus]